MSKPKFGWHDEIKIKFTPASPRLPIVWSASASDCRGAAVDAKAIGLLAVDPDNLGAVLAFTGVAGAMQITIEEPGHVTKLDLESIEPAAIPGNIQILVNPEHESQPQPVKPVAPPPVQPAPAPQPVAAKPVGAP